MDKYENLFTPLSVKGLEIRNRIAMMPMATNMADANGGITDEHIRYYIRRAKGGVGLILVENVCVDFPLGLNGPTQLRFDHDRYAPGLSRLTDRLHEQGAKVALQLNHAGAAAMPSRIGARCVSSSDRPFKAGRPLPRPLAREELPVIADKFALAAARAVTAGFDAVDIHCAHTYLINQFFSPHYNRRTDEFGGSPENRARFPRMVLEKVREAVGPDFPVLMRVSADELIEGGNTLPDVLRLLEYLDDLVDVYNVSATVGDTLFYMTGVAHLEDGWRAYMAGEIKKKFRKPVIAQGNIRNPAVAEKLLAEGCADIIGLGRALIAEPDWAQKVRQGRESDLRPCIYCNIGCTESRNVGMKPIRCTVNPDVVDNGEARKYRVKSPANVVIVGGGIAGLEAACTAAEAGLRAFVLEQGARTGGQARDIARLPAKRRLADLADWMEQRARALHNLHVFTGTKADPAILRALKPDIVISATGSRPLIPDIPGLRERIDAENGRIFSISGLLGRIRDFGDCGGQSVAVAGGGAVGLDVMEFFAEKGAKVTVIEMLEGTGRDLDITMKDYTDYLLAKYGVEVLTRTKLAEVSDRSFILEGGGGRFTRDFDIGVVCLGMRPVLERAEELRRFCEDGGIPFLSIGDGKRPRKLIDATAEGRNLLTVLEHMGILAQ